VPAAANANIARHLAAMAAAQPLTPALKVPRGRTPGGDIDYLALNFSELAAEVAAWEARLTARGVRRGDRTLLMVKPGLPLIAAAFGLFRLGAVPVIIDPGMGLRHFLACVVRTRPRALVGIPLAQLVSRVFPRSFRSVAARVPVPNALTARLAAPGAAGAGSVADNAPDDLAAILFTSGSTGAPKGVCYEHGMFDAQIGLLRAAYGIAPGEVDLPLLPIFALFNPALGMTSVIPEIDPRRPATVDPAKIVQAIRQEGVTNSFGSPTLWRIISDHCHERKLALPSLRRVLCAGAPVPAALWHSAAGFLPHGQLHSPYGATEALPVSTISAGEVAGLAGAGARGAPVGRPLEGITVRIIAVTDGPIATLAEARELPRGEIGEIIVRGPVVTKVYDAQPEATALAKIADGADCWHRMGDCGYLDRDGRLWFCGRKAERVETADGPLHTEICEQVFRADPRAGRCALIGLGPRGRQEPALVVEAKVGREAPALAAELRALGRLNPATAAIRRFYFRPAFPVDVRHNAKIHRLTLARWAATARGHETP
jgi:acyl-CoA synthetase (AMP-forming)/AMP-acid ligase II